MKSEHPVARRLRERAASYSRDADVLGKHSNTDLALIYNTVRDELRKVADEVDVGSVDSQ